MDYSNAMNVGRNTKCVECMCLMTLFQEHISSKHSSHSQFSKHFELSEWQQAGYKQIIKWTLECDRCNFKTTSKIEMFEHIANHQVLEDTVQRISQSSASQPSSTPVPRPSPIRKEKPLHNSSIFPDCLPNHTNSRPGLIIHGEQNHEDGTSPESDSDVGIKEEKTDAILIHMEEADISEVTRTKARKKPLTVEQMNGGMPMYGERPVFPTASQPGPSEQNGTFRCSWCEFAGHNPDSLMYHSRVEHKMFNCGICEYVGSNSTDLESHMPAFHDSMLCIYCGVDGGNSRALRRHYSLDHGTKVKQCKQCGFTTPKKTELTRHINTEHHKRKPRACPYCDYVAYADNHMRQHVQAIHEKRKPFGCPQCPKMFGRKFQVKEHLKRKHNVMMTPSISLSLDQECRAAKQFQTKTESPGVCLFMEDESAENNSNEDLIKPFVGGMAGDDMALDFSTAAVLPLPE